MTLYRQLLVVIILLFLVMFSGTLWVNFQSTRAFLTDQLESHAQDTATILGLSLSPHMAQEDLPMMNSMVDAIFDRGYYQTINLVSMQGQALIKRNRKVQVEGVPDWFIKRITLHTPQAESVVMSGWKRSAIVVVQSHPGYAYKELWRTAGQMLIWFVVTAVLIAILGALVLRAMLKPLLEVERQAEALCARKYEIQGKIPRTRELRNVVVAMNRMTNKVKSMFDEQSAAAHKMRELAFQDKLTGMGNRRYFDVQLENALRRGDDTRKGALLLIQVQDLGELNDTQGYAAGDRLLQAAAHAIKVMTGDVEGRILARLSGSDFGLLAPNAAVEDAEQLAKNICKLLAELSKNGMVDTENVGHIGLAMYTSGDEVAALLAEGDLALRAAQSRGANEWYRHIADDSRLPEIHGRRAWQTHITTAIEQKNLLLHTQKVVNVDAVHETLQEEVLVRIPGKDDMLMAAGLFMPMAEQLDVASELDRIVVGKVLDHMAHVRSGVPLAINLSMASLRDTGFKSWLFEALRAADVPANKLVFEFSEYWAIQELALLRAFVERIREMNLGFGLDHFGRGFSSFGYLQSLRPDYVKIDNAYTAGVAYDKDNSFFVRTLCSVAHSLDITAIAVAVEDQGQWEVLKELNVDGIQGFAASRPAPMNSNS